MPDNIYRPDYPPHNNGNLSRTELVQKVQENANWVQNAGGERAYFAYEDFSNKTFGGLNFAHATMSFTNCQGATFSGCDFREANFRGANLSGADLSGCNLAFSNFREADLTGVNLTNTNIYYCIGNGKEIKNVYTCKFLATYTSAYMGIGCMYHDLDWWRSCTLEDILEVYSEGDASYLYTTVLSLILRFVDEAPAIETIHG